MKSVQPIKLFSVFVTICFITSALPENILENNFSFLTKEFQSNITFYSTYIKKRVLNYALHEILTEFLSELLVLRKYKDLPMQEVDINTLVDTIDYGDFTLDELFVFRNQMLLLCDRNKIIHDEQHLKTHILHDIKTIFAYLENEFQIFKEELHQLEDRFDFECKMRKVSSQLGQILETINIYYFWFQALVFYPEQEINEAALRRAIFDRLILERPHWLSYFVKYPVANVDMTMYRYL